MLGNKYYSKIRRVLKKANLKFEKVFFFKIDLATYCLDLEEGGIKILRTDNIEDLNSIITARGESFLHRYEKWITRGYLCFCAVLENQVIGVLWLNNTDVGEVLFGYKERIKDSNSEAWVIDGYVLDKYRQMGAYKLIWNKVLYMAKDKGIRYIYAAIQNSNHRSFKVHYKLGMNSNVYKILYYFRIAWFNVYITRRFTKLRDIANLKGKAHFI